MLFTHKHQTRVTALEHKFSFLEARVEMLSKALANHNFRLIELENAAYGLRKDGTPRAKPGRKAKVQA